jgi:phosphatidylglycerol lysyltransferase
MSTGVFAGTIGQIDLTGTGSRSLRAHDATKSAAHASTGVPLHVRIALLRQHGSGSQSYSATFQPELEHFGDERGFLAYKKVWGTTLVLCDPMAPRENVEDLISRFLQEHPDAAFWYVSHQFAQVLAARGFYVNAMGPDTWIDLPTYNFAGTKKKQLREAVNRMTKGGFVTRECSLAEVGIDKVKAVSDAWRKTKTVRNREVAFLNRPLVLAEELDVRRFFTFDRDGKLVAFGFFDPVYEGGKVVGYTSQHNRNLPEADVMVHFAIKRIAIETFQKEGLKVLHLGLSPFCDVFNDQEFKANRNWTTSFYFNRAHKDWTFNRFFYPNRGHEAHKRAYRGVQAQNYYAFNRLPSLPRVVKVMRACKLI